MSNFKNRAGQKSKFFKVQARADDEDEDEDEEDFESVSNNEEEMSEIDPGLRVEKLQ